MGNLISPTRSLLPVFSRAHWLSDLKHARSLVSRFNKIQPDLGFNVNFETFVRLFGQGQSVSSPASPRRVKSSTVPQYEIKEVFNVWSEHRDRTADALQIFAGTILCCRATFNEKVEALFEIFDMNNDGHVSREEMNIMVSSALHGMSRMTGCVPPSNEVITEVSRLCFRAADRQNYKGLRSISAAKHLLLI